MNDGIRVFLDKNVERLIKQEADAEHISPGQYISMIVAESLADRNLSADIGDEAPENRSEAKDRSNKIVITLYGEDADMLKQKAAAMGLTPTSYIRRLAYTKEYVTIEVPTDDLRDLIDRFIELEKAFCAAVGFIKRSEGVIFTQDLELLKDYMSEIKELFKQQVKITYASRLKVEQKMARYIRDQIKKSR